MTTQTSPPPTPQLADTRSPRLTLGKWIDLAGPAIALLIIFFIFVLLVPDWSEDRSLKDQLFRFANFDNISNILRQSCMTAVATLGMTLIIIAGGIDLSAGSLAALTGVLIAVVLTSTHMVPDQSGMPVEVLRMVSHPIAWPLLAGAVGIFVGMLAGTLNGLLVTGLRVVPFIITLGTMMILRGTAKHFGHESNVPTDRNWLWTLMANPSDFGMNWLIFPPAIWITLFLAIFMAVILNYSRFGRYVIAIGSNEQTARLCGIPVARTKLFVYILGGLFAGFAGLFFYSRLRQGDPTSANAFELDVIAAVVIGGASLSGGKGSIFGSLVGAAILNVIARGCAQIHIPHFMRGIIDSPTGLPSYIQEIVTGFIIIVAVLLDRLRQRRPS